MLVRLTGAWIDPHGVFHAAGEHVDIDMVTLAELEEQGMVESMTEPNDPNDPDWTNQTGTDPEPDPEPDPDPDPNPDWTNQTSTNPQTNPF